MKRLPGIFILLAGIALGVLGFWAVQKATASEKQPECENLQLQVQLLELRTARLQMTVRMQDSTIAEFRKILGYLPDSADEE